MAYNKTNWVDGVTPLSAGNMNKIEDQLESLENNKVDKVSGKGLSTEDYTTAEKNKLAGIQAGAQVNTVTSVAGKTGAVTVTKSDVGLGSVQNYGIATQAEAEEGTSNAKYMTPLRVKQAIDKASTITVSPGDYLLPLVGGVVSGYIATSISASANPAPSSYEKLIELEIPCSGTYRVTFTLTHSWGKASAYARIYVNGAARGVERTGDKVTFTEDITVNKGDKLQIYGRNSATEGTKICSISELKLGISVNKFIPVMVTYIRA